MSQKRNCNQWATAAYVFTHLGGYTPILVDVYDVRLRREMHREVLHSRGALLHPQYIIYSSQYIYEYVCVSGIIDYDKIQVHLSAE